MRFSFIFSPDSALLLKKAEEYAQNFFTQNPHPPLKHVFWADEPLSRFWQLIAVPNLEPTADAVLIRNADKLDADTWKKISTSVGTLHENVYIIFCMEQEWEKKAPKIPAYIANQKCYTFSEKKGWNVRIQPLDSKSLASYVQKAMKERDLTCDKALFETLYTLFPHKAAAVDNTLDQLALIAENNVVKHEDIMNYVPNVVDIIVFDYIRYLESNNSLELWRNILSDESKADEVFFALLANITREARILWQLLHNDSVRLPPMIVDRKKQQAQRLGKKRIAILFKILRDADWSIKSGTKKVGQSMEQLLYDLSRIYRV